MSVMRRLLDDDLGLSMYVPAVLLGRGRGG